MLFILNCAMLLFQKHVPRKIECFEILTFVCPLNGNDYVLIKYEKLF